MKDYNEGLFKLYLLDLPIFQVCYPAFTGLCLDPYNLGSSTISFSWRAPLVPQAEFIRWRILEVFRSGKLQTINSLWFWQRSARDGVLLFYWGLGTPCPGWMSQWRQILTDSYISVVSLKMEDYPRQKYHIFYGYWRANCRSSDYVFSWTWRMYAKAWMPLPDGRMKVNVPGGKFDLVLSSLRCLNLYS